MRGRSSAKAGVAPFAGAWIETSATARTSSQARSPPSRGRGSKHSIDIHRARLRRVAPFAGAWIETIKVMRAFPCRCVAPFAGAWIETGSPPRKSLPPPSPPSRGRGSKLKPSEGGTGSPSRPLRGGVDRNPLDAMPLSICRVAPFAGAWIETISEGGLDLIGRMSPPSRGRGSKLRASSRAACHPASPPSRGRGSKLFRKDAGSSYDWSPPSRGRGSKPSQGVTGALRGLSPPSRGRGSKLVGMLGPIGAPGRPLRGGVDRNDATELATLEALERRPLRGGVDRNPSRAGLTPDAKSSPPSRGRGSKLGNGQNQQQALQSPPSRGRGSKRGLRQPHLRYGSVAPFAGAWIETSPRSPSRRSPPGRPLRGGVDRNRSFRPSICSTACRPLRGGVDRNMPTSGSAYFGPVAPFAGAWIETCASRSALRALNRSPPSRGRGSKHGRPDQAKGYARVAPFAGAWIETAGGEIGIEFHGRPLRGGVDRNLDCGGDGEKVTMSPPSRGRGSKPDRRHADGL